jgi:hypothetical protein
LRNHCIDTFPALTRHALFHIRKQQKRKLFRNKRLTDCSKAQLLFYVTYTHPLQTPLLSGRIPQIWYINVPYLSFSGPMPTPPCPVLP